MPAPIKLISSMATRQLLGDLVARLDGGAFPPVQVESVGGVDAAKRVRAGEALDGAVLSAKAIDELIAAGQLLPDSRVDLVRSGVAVAVRAGTVAPDIGSEDAVRAAVLAAPSLSYSTGPSGVYLEQLFARWGILDAIRARIVQAPPGVPVGTLVARGEVALGFQQLSELMFLDGIRVVGPLPPAIQTITTFSAGVSVHSVQPDAVRAVLRAWASDAVADVKRANGMEPA